MVWKFHSSQGSLIEQTSACIRSITIKIQMITRIWAPSIEKKEQSITSHKTQNKISALSLKFLVMAMHRLKTWTSKMLLSAMLIESKRTWLATTCASIVAMWTTSTIEWSKTRSASIPPWVKKLSRRLRTRTFTEMTYFTRPESSGNAWTKLISRLRTHTQHS